MARIDTLLEDVTASGLREALREEVAELRKQVSFGLVFERHLPEFAVVPGEPVVAGSTATLRRDNGRRLRVIEVNDGKADVVENGSAEPETIDLDELNKANIRRVKACCPGTRTG